MSRLSSKIRWDNSSQNSSSIPNLSSGERRPRGMTHVSTPLLEQIGRDLTRLALEGRLNPLFGRQKELRQLQRIMLRKQKNNPLLIGAPGVGKTALVEGLASLIARGECAIPLRETRIIELSAASLVSDTSIRGTFESRMQELIREASQPNLILFVDEIHTLFRAGATGGGALDAANILKPALSRGEIRLIGATTPNEKDRFLSSDPAFERRFEPLFVQEPTETEAIDILMAALSQYEAHHQVRILPEAVVEAVRLSNRMILDRCLPDKAFDLLDLACSYVRLPEPELNHPNKLPQIVDEQIVRLVLSNRLKIPVGDLDEDIRSKLAAIEQNLSQKIFGQPIALRKIALSLQRAYSGLNSSDRPIIVMAFFGSSGVGKTATAKALAALLFGSSDAMIRLDMSEYKEPHSISRWFGPPPGYVGYEDENTFAARLRHQPHAIVLLDEIEKAHPQILDALLQIFDEGRFTDTHDRLVDARHAIFILTSNLYTNPAALDEEAYQSQVETIRANLNNFFRPELVNRIQEIVVFQELDVFALRRVAAEELKILRERLEQRRVELVVADNALDWLAKEAYDRNRDARSAIRLVGQKITEPIASLVVSGLLTGHKRIFVDIERNELTIKVEESCAST